MKHLLLALLLTACGNEVVIPDTVEFTVKSETTEVARPAPEAKKAEPLASVVKSPIEPQASVIDTTEPEVKQKEPAVTRGICAGQESFDVRLHGPEGRPVLDFRIGDDSATRNGFTSYPGEDVDTTTMGAVKKFEVKTYATPEYVASKNLDTSRTWDFLLTYRTLDDALELKVYLQSGADKIELSGCTIGR